MPSDRKWPSTSSKNRLRTFVLCHLTREKEQRAPNQNTDKSRRYIPTTNQKVRSPRSLRTMIQLPGNERIYVTAHNVLSPTKKGSEVASKSKQSSLALMAVEWIIKKGNIEKTTTIRAQATKGGEGRFNSPQQTRRCFAAATQHTNEI